MPTLPHARHDDDSLATLGISDDLVVHAALTSNGQRYVTIGWTDGTGLVFAPLAESAALDKLFSEAEQELAKLGLIDSPSVTH